MKYSFALAVLLTLVSFSSVSALVANPKPGAWDEQLPHGKYCGSYAGGVVKGTITLHELVPLVDVYLQGFGDEALCEDEVYIYDPITHHGILPGAMDPEDCLGRLIAANGLTLDIYYDPAKDVVKLDLGITHIDCKQCA